MKECKDDQGRVCDGSVSKELSKSKQVSKVVVREMSDKFIMCKVCKNGKLKVQSNKKIPADTPKHDKPKIFKDKCRETIFNSILMLYC